MATNQNQSPKQNSTEPKPCLSGRGLTKGDHKKCKDQFLAQFRDLKCFDETCHYLSSEQLSVMHYTATYVL